MNNLPARAYDSPVVYDAYASQSTSYPTTTKVISTIALLVLGYYALSVFDAWPSTIQRYCYESFIYLLPSRLLYIMQRALVRLGRLTPEEARFSRADFGNMFAKEEAVQRMFGPPQMPLVLRQVRSLSGVADYISSSNDIGPPGLGNWDNSCYQNSVLQGLASLPGFVNFLQRSLEMCQQYKVKAETHEALVAFLEKLADSNGRKTTLWTPKVLKSMDSWQQQDAQEYFSRILDAAEKEASGYIKQLKKPSSAGLECLKGFKTAKGEGLGGNDGAESESTLSTIGQSAAQLLTKTASLGHRNPLDGMTAQALECKVCGYTEGLSLTQFNCLTLNMGLRGVSSVEDLLDEFTAPEEVEGVECEHCTKMAHGNEEPPSIEGAEAEIAADRPKKKPTPVLRTKAKQITIGRLPEDLVLHINRSIFDEYGNQLKNTAPVEVPVKFDFLSRWCAPLEKNRGAVAAIYDLKCIVTHYGRHENGHYVALGKRGKDWYSFNDEMVTKVSEEEVLRRGNGFMLFYELTPYHSEGPLEPQLAGPLLEQPTETGPSSEANSTTEIEKQPADDFDSETLESQSTAAPSTHFSEDSVVVSETSSPIGTPCEALDKEQEIPFLKTAGLSGSERHEVSETPLISPL